MELSHPVFGELDYDEVEGYITQTVVPFLGKDREVELVLSELWGEGGIEPQHVEAYEAMKRNWDALVADMVQAIIHYQNENWDSSDHTQSFPVFKTVEDVREHVELISIKLEAGTPDDQEGRYIVIVFSAEWVNNDYGVLSVGLINEKVVQVTDQDL